MAQVTTRKLEEGPRNLVLHVFFESDGVSGELDNHVLLPPKDFSPAQEAKPTLRIVQVWYALVWFDVVLKFGGIVPRPALVLARDHGPNQDFCHFGGIADTDTVPPSDNNGSLLVSTNGFAQAGSQGSLILALRK